MVLQRLWLVPWLTYPHQGRRRALTLTSDNSARRELLKEAANEIEHGWVCFTVTFIQSCPAQS